MRLKHLLSMAAAGALMCSAAAIAHAQSASGYPSKPIRIILPYSPGGAGDGFARQLGLELTATLGQPVIVDNRPGGQSVPAMQALTAAAPDGHTFAIFGTEGVTINHQLFKRPPYNPEKLEAVARLADIPFGIIVRADYPANNLKEFIQRIKSDNSTAFASPGAGTPIHLMMEVFRQRAGLEKMVHVPYKGSAPAIQDMLSGQVSVAMLDPATPLQHIKAGKIRLLAVASDKRLPNFPDVPTIAESGYPGFSAIGWYAAYAPPGTPPEIVDKLSAALKAAVQTPKISKWLIEMELIPAYMPPAETKAETAKETASYGAIVKRLGISMDN
ncbi:tripartite tricarboxylate transporter substrate binding protein [Variovorax sp. WS11]|uniref:Bug family tripartite tricarboxylate transporter substrate binding protein n=1 Tax=Variovorax sp. WS11 TaxID=1105204 RepID=UPI000D0CCCBF|nr:tripartite tricarboxylate transporter substrate binding protein [Variovorax sp. WS11]NDZ16092.1 tripartite tricarboxylate transporter substrate binding protein [Variovorax sp. WS11]PSL83233.1 tripartite tricarboxylate transporter substrate binding protein [Variovorax sp. WS11]